MIPLAWYHEGWHYTVARLLGLEAEIEIDANKRIAKTHYSEASPWQDFLVTAAPIVGTLILIWLLIIGITAAWGPMRASDWLLFGPPFLLLLGTCGADFLAIWQMTFGKRLARKNKKGQRIRGRNKR